MCFTTTTKSSRVGHQKRPAKMNHHFPVLPGLPDDIAKLCLARVPRSEFPVVGKVCKKWRAFVQSKEFMVVRKEVGKLEEWLYILTGGSGGKTMEWAILGSSGEELKKVPPMPSPVNIGYGSVALNGKLLVMGGYSSDVGSDGVCADVYQYDSLLNSWNKLEPMNVARFDFGCAVVNGMVYVVGGYGANGDSLSSVEVYDPEKNEWALSESLRRPRWGCFTSCLEGKLYVMGGRSSFTIGHAKSVDIYDPESHSWLEMKNGCVMVTAHASIGRRLFCVEWKDQRKLAVFDAADRTWRRVEVPFPGSAAIAFQFGVLSSKLLLFAQTAEEGYRTLVYDPEAARGAEWGVTGMRMPPGMMFLSSVTFEA